MTDAEQLVTDGLDWLREHYDDFHFFVERDIVWTLQLRLRAMVEGSGLTLRVFNDFAILPGKRRALCTDIAIVSAEQVVEYALEFKYEPSHRRVDIDPHKFPVVSWGNEGVAKDVDRVRRFIAERRARAARFCLIDEGGHFQKRTPHPGTRWVSWGNGRWVLIFDASY